jgi:hypothetical protein
MSCMVRFALAVGVLAACLEAVVAQAAGRVVMEVATDEGFNNLEAQTWARMLAEWGVSARIRGRTANDKPEVVTEGSRASPTYRVTGVLTARGVLVVPGGQFTLRDRASLGQWIEQLRQYGPGGRPQPREETFGLSDEELRQVQRTLSQRVNFSTKDADRSELAARLLAMIDAAAALDRAAAGALAEVGPVWEELQGLSCGTVLAYVLRPAGLALVPGKDARGLTYRVATSRSVPQMWPVGVSAEDRRRELLPALFEFRTIEVERGTRLLKALRVIGEDLHVPVLYDYNYMVAQGIEVDTVTVQLPARKSALSVSLQSLLGQARLRYELRVDEAGTPFLWVTTYRGS